MSFGKRNSILGGAVALTLSALIVKIVGVLYKIPLSYMLGESGMGYFNSAYTVYGIFYVISSAGIPKAVTMVVAEMGESADEEYLRRVCKKLIGAFSRIGAVVTLLFLILADPIAYLIGNSRSLATMLAIAPSIFFVTVSGVLKGYLSGCSRFSTIAISQMIEVLCKLLLGLALAVIGIRLHLPLTVVSALGVLGITLGSVFSSVYMYFACFGGKGRDNKGKSISEPAVRVVRNVLKKALPITASAAIISVSGLIDLVLVMRGLRGLGYSEDVANAIYGNYSTLAMPMINLVASLLMPINVALLPKLVSLNRKGEAFCASFGKAWIATLVISAPAAILYALYAFDILDLLFASSASANGALALAALSPVAILLPLLNLVNTALEARGRMNGALLSLALGVLLKIVLGAILIPDSRLGIIGAAIGTVASYAFSLVMSLILLGRTRLGHFGLGKALPAVLIAIFAYVPCFILIYACNLFANSLISLAVAVLLPSVIYLAAVVFLYFTEDLRALKDHNAQKKLVHEQ